MAPTTIAETRSDMLRQLRETLQQDPEFAIWIEGLLAEKFPRRDEFARLLDEVQAHRQETQSEFARADQRFDKVEAEVQAHRQETKTEFVRIDQRFEQVDQRFEQVDQRLVGIEERFARLEAETRDGFSRLERQIDRLGARWGIRNEQLFRQTMRSVLETSFGATVQELTIGGEQYDCLITNHEHILIEITASAGRNMLARLQRKRQLYLDTTGIAPSRFILAVSSIHSHRAAALRAAGFDVIEPEFEFEDEEA